MTIPVPNKKKIAHKENGHWIEKDRFRKGAQFSAKHLQ